MRFLSIKEFFYKINTIGFILLLLPLTVFVYLYYQPSEELPKIPDELSKRLMLGATSIMLITALTIVHWQRKNNVKKLKVLIELSRKLDGYFELFLMRMLLYTGVSIALVVCYYLTGDLLFTGLFILVVIITFLQWPTRSAFCRMLGLTGSEREMVLHNTDTEGKRNKKTSP